MPNRKADDIFDRGLDRLVDSFVSAIALDRGVETALDADTMRIAISRVADALEDAQDVMTWQMDLVNAQDMLLKHGPDTNPHDRAVLAQNRLDERPYSP